MAVPDSRGGDTSPLLIDGHTHLDHNDAAVADQLHRARLAGVEWMIQSGTDVASSRRAIALAHAFPEVFATVGIHPHDAGEAPADAVEKLRELAADPKVVAVGETGLDFYRNRSPREAQEAVFVAQMALAREMALPVVIHTRDADRRSLPLLREHAADLTVILHCFSMPQRVQELIERGWYLSFAGNVTYKTSEPLREALRAVPDHLLLLETDAPYLTPEPHRGHPNEPSLVVHTYRRVAQERGLSVEELADRVRANVLAAYPRLGEWLSGGEREGGGSA